MNDWSTDTEKFLEFFPGHHIFIAMEEYGKGIFHLHDGYKGEYGAEITLRGRNEGEWGAFFTVNELDEEKDPSPIAHRTGKMWVRSRAIFMDDDNPRMEPRDDFPLVPSIVVRTSGNEGIGWKFHYYWLIGDDCSIDEWKGIQNGLIEKWDGDRNAKDLSRYLRLPGYKHNKKGSGVVVVWKGNGRVWTWEEIKMKFPVGTGKKVVSAGGGNVVEMASKPRNEAIAEIESEKDFHDNLVSLSYQNKQNGMDKRANIEFCQMCMKASAGERDERWQSRYDDIERTVKGALLKQECVSLEGLEFYSGDDDHYTKEWDRDERGRIVMDWPPGALGQLAKDAYEMQIFQYREVAVVSAIGLVAGICGRKFNVSDTGLNVCLTLIMSTGMGKDSIGKFIYGTLNRLQMTNAAGVSFKGGSRFTGPKSLLESLRNARSQVCVMTEAGLLMRSKAGDQDGLTRALLSLYGSSGAYNESGAELFSKLDDSIMPVMSPALTLVSEATPSTLLEAFKNNDSLERGDLPRQSIYRVTGDKPHLKSLSRPKEVSHEMKARLSTLVNTCKGVQAENDPKAWDMEWEDNLEQEALDFGNGMVDQENDTRESDPVKCAMLTRAGMKAMKFAALATVFNYSSEDENPLVIKQREWDWAKRMVEFEMDGVNKFFAGSGMTNDPRLTIMRKYAEIIRKIITGGYKNARHQSDALQRRRGEFPLAALNQLVGDDVKQLGKESRLGKAGTTILIGYYVEDEYLVKVSDRPLVYKCTEYFALLAKDKSEKKAKAKAKAKAKTVKGKKDE